MIINIRHTGIVVRDLSKAVAFYEALGFRTWLREQENGQFLEQVIGLKKVQVETAKLKLPCGESIELLQYHSHKDRREIERQRPNQLGCSHIAFSVISIENSLALIRSMGGSQVNHPASNGKVKVAYCHDLEGNLLELVENII